MVHSIDLCDDEMLADLREAFSGHLARGAQPQTRAAFLKLHDAAFSFDAPRTLDISINLSRLLVSGLAAADELCGDSPRPRVVQYTNIQRTKRLRAACPGPS